MLTNLTSNNIKNMNDGKINLPETSIIDLEIQKVRQLFYYLK